MAEEEELTDAIDKAILAVAERAEQDSSNAGLTAAAAAVRDLADARAWITHPHVRSGS